MRNINTEGAQALSTGDINVFCLDELLRVFSVSYTHLDVYKRQVIILIETSEGAAPLSYFTPDTSTTPSSMYFIVSISKMESTPCMMQARRSIPMPVSIFG